MKHFPPNADDRALIQRGFVVGTSVAMRGARCVGLAVSTSQSELEDALERYCAAHPNAADTIDGARRWWLADPAIPLADVEAALESLVRRGMLDVRHLPDGTAVYFNRSGRSAED